MDVTLSGAIFSHDDFDLSEHFDFSGLESITLEYESELLALTDLTDAFYSIFDTGPTFSALTGELTVTYGSTVSDALVIEGDGLTPSTYTSLEDFMTALENGLATGSFDTLRVFKDGDEIVTISLSDEGMTFQSGDFYFGFQGNLPAQTQDVYDFVQSVTNLITNFASLSEPDLATILGVIGDYGLDGFALGEGEDELFSVSLSDTQFQINLAGGSLTVDGTFPGTSISDVFDFSDALLTALDNGIVSMSELTDLDVTSIALVNQDGDDLIVVEGDMSGIEVDDDGAVDDSTLPSQDVTIEGSDDDDELFDPLFLDTEVDSVRVNLNDGDDEFEINGDTRDNNSHPGDISAPMTVDGGDGFDTLVIDEGENASVDVTIDFEEGMVESEPRPASIVSLPSPPLAKSSPSASSIRSAPSCP